MIILLVANKKDLRQNLTPLHDKGIGEMRDKRNIPKHNKGNIQQTNSQHHTKWRETQSDPIKVRNKTSLPTLFVSIQYNT